MFRGFCQGTIISSLNFYRIKNQMTNQIIQKNISTKNYIDVKKSNLDILTEENDRLLKSLKRPGGSYRAA